MIQAGGCTNVKRYRSEGPYRHSFPTPSNRSSSWLSVMLYSSGAFLNSVNSRIYTSLRTNDVVGLPTMKLECKSRHVRCQQILAGHFSNAGWNTGEISKSARCWSSAGALVLYQVHLLCGCLSQVREYEGFRHLLVCLPFTRTCRSRCDNNTTHYLVQYRLPMLDAYLVFPRPVQHDASTIARFFGRNSYIGILGD